MTVFALLILFRLEHIEFRSITDYGSVLSILPPLALVAAYCRWARLGNLYDSCALIAWAFLLLILLPLPSYAAARIGFPLADGALRTIDGYLGVNVASIVAWTGQHAALNSLAAQVYSSLPILVFIAILIPALAARENARRFILAVLISVAIGNLLFILLPAAGPWEGYGFAPSHVQAVTAAELRTMRVTDVASIDPSASGGLIAFPSFHVALSVLAASALWRFRWLRPVAVLWALAISISTMMIGWHYAVDVIGGIMTAGVSMLAAQRMISARENIAAAA